MSVDAGTATVGEKSLIDSHVHWIAVGDRPEQGWLSPKLRQGWAFRAASRKLGVPVQDLPALARAYQDRLAQQLRSSKRVKQAVILALDGVYDSAGRIDFSRTSLYVPNDAVLNAAKANPDFLPAPSVNPSRRDALEELARVIEAGAVLLKWLPNTQEFDPADRIHRPFFRALADARLPVLIHTGVEYAIPSRWQKMGDPARWREALEEGVTIIAAHGASSGSPIRETANPAFLWLVDRYPNLYADSAALTAAPRARVLGRLKRHGEGIRRLTFGTDYPIPPVPHYLLMRGKISAFREVIAETNYFDRHVRILTALGWAPECGVLERLRSRRASG